MGEKRFIESEAFAELIPKIDKKSSKEKGPARPPYWDMVFWWTRKPLISARAFVATSLLPEKFDQSEFKRITKLGEDVPHKHEPARTELFKNYTLLDPFAGFGSIPLEAKRLGVGKVIASDLLPTATFYLKAVLEYPKYGQGLLEDVKKYGQELLKRIVGIAKELYGDYAGFVGTWEVRCPHCGSYTPLVNQWWLMAIQGSSSDEDESGEEEVKSGTFRRLVYMEPVVSSNQVRVVPRDLNAELGKKHVKARKTKDRIVADGKEFKVPEGNVKADKSYAKCLVCNNAFPGRGDSWYVKEAIREWNKNYERFLNGEITLEELKNSKARPVLLVKFKGDGKYLKFEEITKENETKFWESFEKLQELDLADVPIEKIATYSTIRSVSWGRDSIYKFYHARQLIMSIAILQEIRKMRSEIPGDAEYRDAVISYLLVSMMNYLRHNSLQTSIHPGRTFIRDALSFRGLSFTWNWVEISPLANIIGSLIKSLNHVIEGLEYLIKTTSNSTIEVLNSDVLGLNLENVDVIVTDPPYAYDVAYPELSDFYYVWIKRVFPFAYRTQWEELVPKDIGVDEERKKAFGSNIGTYEYFRERLAEAFKKLYRTLKEDGLLVTFYNHTSPETWTSLLYAGWHKSGFKISSAHAITTEDETRITARNTAISLDKSIVITWRKKAEGVKPVHDVRREAVEEVSQWFSKQVSKGAELNLDTYIEVLGKAMEVFTKYEKLIGLKGEGVQAVEDLVSNYIFPTTAQAIVEGLSKGVGVRIANPYSTYYVLVKVLFPPSRGGPRKLDKNSLTFLNISGNIDTEDLEKNGIVSLEEDSITLVEPVQEGDINSLISSLESMSHIRSAIAGKMEFFNPVQVLHYIEYISLKDSANLSKIIEELREKTRYVDEALAMAKIFSKVLREEDPEKILAKRMVEEEKVGIERYFG